MANQSPTNLWKNITDTNMSFHPETEQLSESPDSEIFFDDEDEKPVDNIVPGVTKIIQKMASDKKKYHHISNTLRLKLIDAIENKNQKIKFAAKDLGINYSSAKSIYQVYKKEGRSDKKLFKRRNFQEEHSREAKDEPNLLNFPGDSTKATFFGETMYPAQTPEASPEEPKDSLMILKERLLASRRGSGQNLQSYELPSALNKGLDGSEKGFVYSQAPFSTFSTNVLINSPFNKNQQQLEPAKINLNEAYGVKFQQPLPSTGNFIVNPNFQRLPTQGGSAIYILAPQMPQMTTSMTMTSSQTPFSHLNMMLPQNVPQNMPMPAPTQTININHPMANNLNIQTLSMPNNKTGPNLNAKESFEQTSVPTMPQVPVQQPQYFPVNMANPMLNQMTGVQMLQPRMIIMPPGNMVPVNIYPQMNQIPQSNVSASSFYYSFSNQSQATPQFNPNYSLVNFTPITENDLKAKYNAVQASNFAPEVRFNDKFSESK